MFKPYQLTIRNFMSFGSNETKINLDFDKPTLIVGRNHDSVVDGQLDSNGAGKTTILNAVNYAIYGTIISDKNIVADNLINNINKKNLYVSLIFTTGNDTFYKIERYRKNKTSGGNGVRLFERVGGNWDDDFTDEHDVTPDSTNNADKKIVQVMGMPFEVFSRIVAFSATHKPFLFLPPSEQTQIIEDICGLSELSEKADVLKKKTSGDKKELERLTEINNTIKAQRRQILDQVASLRGKVVEWDNAKTENIERIERELSEISASSIDYEEQVELFDFISRNETSLASLTSERRELVSEIKFLVETERKRHEWDTEHANTIQRLSDELQGFEALDFNAEFEKFKHISKIVEEIASVERLLERIAAEKTRLLSERESKITEFEHLTSSKCPYCSQQYEASKTRLKNVEDEIQSLNTTIEDLEVDEDTMGVSLVTCKSAATTASETLRFKTERELMDYNSKYDALCTKLEHWRGMVNPHVEELEGTSVEALEADLTTIENKIVKKELKLNEARSLLLFDKVQDVTTHQNKLNNLTEELAKASKEENPLLSTLSQLESITLEETKDDEIESLMDEIEHQQFLVKLLTKKDSFVRKTLLQKSLPFLNTRLRYYLDKIGFLHKVAFKEDLSVSISQFNNTIGFENLSSGQKARINLALSFSFRDMLQARHGKLKFCILDECLDVGLGNVGVQLAAKMIKSVATDEKLAMFIISHRDEVGSMFDNKLIVELERGFSNIVEE